MRITVGIGTRRLTSEDGGELWIEGTREVPWCVVSRVRGLPHARVVPTLRPLAEKSDPNAQFLLGMVAAAKEPAL